MSSDSSDSEHEVQVPKREPATLSLNDVTFMVREYERMERRERKERIDKGIPKNEVVITPESLEKIQLTKKQLRILNPPKERTERQKEAALAMAQRNRETAARKKADAEALREKKRQQLVAEKGTIDLRSDKTKEGIRVKIAHRKSTAKQEPVSEPEDSEEEPPVRSYQAKKPALVEDDEVDLKVSKLNKLNSVLTSNPYYAQVMASRGIRF